MQLKFLILIEFPSILHWKPVKKSNGCGLGAKFAPNYVQRCEKSKETGNIVNFFFLHILLGEYLLKQKLVVVKPPEWKFMAIIARNATF